ncbi:hypothetical protein ACIOWK_32585 [Pseudomonas protegens]|uniref:hypothetical protein n=1 Tax=Pseudomonas protegens TaxID=380021 RepID=UPI0038236B58
MSNLRIWWLKRKARAAYIRYLAAIDRLGCGNEIATHVSRDVRESRSTFNLCMDRLAEMGEPIPGKRL